MDHNLATFDFIPSPRLTTNLPSWQVPSIGINRIFSSSQIGEIYPLRLISSSWKDDAIRQLGELNTEAEEEDYPTIEDKAIETAAHLLAALDRHRIEPDVYPSMDGDIAIYFKAPNRPLSFLITIDSGQRIGCYAAGDRDSQHVEFGTLSEDAIGHMHDVLNRMESPIALQGRIAGILR